jgi:hypothetical protein
MSDCGGKADILLAVVMSANDPKRTCETHRSTMVLPARTRRQSGTIDQEVFANVDREQLRLVPASATVPAAAAKQQNDD